MQTAARMVYRVRRSFGHRPACVARVTYIHSRGPGILSAGYLDQGRANRDSRYPSLLAERDYCLYAGTPNMQGTRLLEWRAYPLLPVHRPYTSATTTWISGI